MYTLLELAPIFGLFICLVLAYTHMQTTESVLEETDDMDEQFMAVARYRQQRQAIETTQATEPAEYQKLLRDSTFRPIETTGAFKGI